MRPSLSVALRPGLDGAAVWGRDLYTFVTSAAGHMMRTLQRPKKNRPSKRQVNHRRFLHNMIQRKFADIEAANHRLASALYDREEEKTSPSSSSPPSHTPEESVSSSHSPTQPHGGATDADGVTGHPPLPPPPLLHPPLQNKRRHKPAEPAPDRELGPGLFQNHNTRTPPPAESNFLRCEEEEEEEQEEEEEEEEEEEVTLSFSPLSLDSLDLSLQVCELPLVDLLDALGGVGGPDCVDLEAYLGGLGGGRGPSVGPQVSEEEGATLMGEEEEEEEDVWELDGDWTSAAPQRETEIEVEGAGLLFNNYHVTRTGGGAGHRDQIGPLQPRWESSCMLGNGDDLDFDLRFPPFEGVAQSFCVPVPEERPVATPPREEEWLFTDILKDGKSPEEQHGGLL